MNICQQMMTEKRRHSETFLLIQKKKKKKREKETVAINLRASKSQRKPEEDVEGRIDEVDPQIYKDILHLSVSPNFHLITCLLIKYIKNQV